MRSFLIFSLCNFFFSFIATSQKLGSPISFGAFTREELDMAVYKRDTSASAVVLCSFGKAGIIESQGKYIVRFEHHKRIKILKKSGLGHGNVLIPFYSYKSREEFFFDKAEITLPNGRKIKLDKKDVFIEAVNDKVSQARFTFPQLEAGSIIEYRYSINSDFIHQLVEWYFQEDIPVKWSELRVDFPEWMVYTYVFQGNEGMQKIQEKKDMVVYVGKNGTLSIAPRRYIMENVPAMQAESFITTMDDYLAKIRFQLAEMKHANGFSERVMTTWKELQQELEHQPFFGEQYLKKSNFRKMAETVGQLADGITNPTDKARFFYDYLTQNLEWDGNFSIWANLEKLDFAFEKRKANSAELNLMLLALLNDAGITAYPLLTSTRSHGKMYEAYPILDQFDHVMVFAIPDGFPVIMDVSDPLRPPGYPNEEALNGRGWLMKKGSQSWMDIKPPQDGTRSCNLDLTLAEDGSLTGILRGAYKGYEAIPERKSYKTNKSGIHWKLQFAGKFPDLKLDSVKFGNLDLLDQPFYDTVFLSFPSAAQANGGFLYLPPVLFFSYEENPFKLSNRDYPVDIPYPVLEQYLLKLTVPPGYALEEIPSQAAYTLPGNGGSFRFAVEEKEDFLLVSARFQIRQLRFMPEEYPAVKEFFDLVVEKLGEQIVFKKKT